MLPWRKRVEGKAISETKNYGKLVMLAVLHMGQYFPLVFVNVALPFLFRKEGLPLEMFWLLALPGIPRWFKWAIALVVDNYGNRRLGQRKSWILPCTALATFGYASLAWVSPTVDSVYLIVAIFFTVTLIMSAQDIAVDAYAAESMNDAERPVGTALINFLGGVAGVLGTIAVALVELLGWPVTMVAAAALLLFAASPALLMREPPPPPARLLREARGEKPSLIKAVTRKDSHRILPYMFMFGFGHYFFLTMLGPFWADQGMSIQDFGLLSAVGAVAGGSLAAVTTPWLIKRVGMRVTAALGLAALPFEAAVYCYFTLTDELPSLGVLMASVAVLSWSTALYLYTATISRFRWASKSQAGTDYSMQSSLWNLGVWAAGSTSGLVAGQFGWVMFFPIAALVTLIGGGYYVWKFDAIEALVRERERAETAAGAMQPSSAG